MHWDYALILGFFAAAVPLLGKRRVDRLLRRPETTRGERLRLYASTILFQWCATGIILWRAAAHGMTMVGLGLAAPRPSLTLLVSAGLAGLILANQLFSIRQIAARPEEPGGRLAQLALRIFPQGRAEQVAFLGVVGTVAVCEEVIYRGFVQGLLAGTTGRAAAGVLVSAGLFGLAHLYQGRRGLLATCIVGIVFASTRLATASLIPAVIAHFTADSAAGFLLPGKLRYAQISGGVKRETAGGGNWGR